MALGLRPDVAQAQASLLQSQAIEEYLSTLSYESEGKSPPVAAPGGGLVSKLKSSSFATRWRKGARDAKGEEKVEAKEEEAVIDEGTNEEGKNEEGGEGEKVEPAVTEKDGKPGEEVKEE